MPQISICYLSRFEALAEALLVVVGWVLWLAPIGVFALALSGEYLSVPASVGFIALLGIAVGPSVLGWIDKSEVLDWLSQQG